MKIKLTREQQYHVFSIVLINKSETVERSYKKRLYVPCSLSSAISITDKFESGISQRKGKMDDILKLDHDCHVPP